MVERYATPEISRIFGDSNKLDLWQTMELSVLQAMVNLNKIDKKIHDEIKKHWLEHSINIDWWKARDETIHHDLNAFLDERYRYLPTDLHCYVHKNITSYDTEEAPFAIMLKEALAIVDEKYLKLRQTLVYMSLQYRYTIMNGRTHGQEAELQTFGARILTWLRELEVAYANLQKMAANLAFSKLSGAIGKYGSIDPMIEKEALDLLGFKPFYGATQIMPRIIYVPIAQALSNMVSVINKIALDIRLAARSGRPLMQEPFQKKQKGSSAMPHKKNPISLEQLKGMARMAVGYANMITENIETWEERTIEQSSVERVAWPDLFHVVIRSLNVMDKVLRGLRVYPDNMLEEIIQSRGTYASSEVKEFLKENLVGCGLSNEDIYRIVQIAAFNVFKPSPERACIREMIPDSFTGSLQLLNTAKNLPVEKPVSLADIIPAANLEVVEDLDVDQDKINQYNLSLRQLFQKPEIMVRWNKLFTPEFLLRNEEVLYQNILGIA